MDILYTGGRTVTVGIVIFAGLIKFRLYSFSVAAINDNGINCNEQKFYSGLHLLENSLSLK